MYSQITPVFLTHVWVCYSPCTSQVCTCTHSCTDKHVQIQVTYLLVQFCFLFSSHGHRVETLVEIVSPFNLCNNNLFYSNTPRRRFQRAIRLWTPRLTRILSPLTFAARTARAESSEFLSRAIHPRRIRIAAVATRLRKLICTSRFPLLQRNRPTSLPPLPPEGNLEFPTS